MQKTGIREVAAAANVSVGTVSKVLNPKSIANIRISPETRQRVLEAATRLNYSASYGAALLRGQSSKTIGFIVNLPNELVSGKLSDYPQRILAGLANAARCDDYQLLLITTGDYRSLLEIKRVDALVVIGFRMVNNICCQEMIDTFQSYNDRQYPYVVINNVCDKIPIPSINIDNAYGMKLVAERIINRRYSSVGFVGEQTENPQSHHCERIAALEKFLRGSGVEFAADMRFNGITHGIAPVVREGEYSQRDGIAVFDFLHSQGRLPRCLVCGNDTIAHGVLHGAYMAGVKVPDELAVIGFDDMPGAEFFTPSLTTVHQPLEEFGAMAFDYIVRKMADHDLFESRLIKPIFQERISG